MQDTNQFSVERTSDREITMARRFQAPASLVLDALTAPSELRQWMSANGRELSSCEVDLRPGGSHRYVFQAGGGCEFTMYGEYREVVPGKRIVHTEAYAGHDWEPLVVTTELFESSGVTTLRAIVRYPSKEICDTDAPDLEHAGATYTALAEHLTKR